MKRLLIVITTIIIIFSILTNTYATSYIVTGDNVNLRSTPQINSNNIITTTNYGDIVEILDSHNNWYLVSTNNTFGYIAADYIGINVTGTAAITTNKLNFRSGPDITYKSHCVIPQYSIIKVIDTSSNWYKVHYNGIVGFVNSDYIKLKEFNNEELLGSYTTYFSTASSQKGRVINIKRGASLLNEYLIEPNSTFSILKTIGPITKEGGYQKAPEYSQTAQGTITVTGYGGGVCQIATTLYQSVLEAKNSTSRIEILERHIHSKPVSYIEYGDDATISWNAGNDFTFKNNNDYSLKIRTYVYDGSITCMIYKCT